MKKLSGIVPAMITALADDGKIDLERIQKHTEFLISAGVDGLYPCGTTGEMLKLSVEERKKVAETVISVAKGRVPVFIHTAAAKYEETIELSLHAQKCGADGIGILTPIFYYYDDREIEEYYVSIAQQVTDIPIYMYNIPMCSANDLNPTVCERVIEKCPNIVGIKYSGMEIARLAQYCKVHQGDFSVMYGIDKLAAPALSVGAAGIVSGCACVIPEPFVALYGAYSKGDLAGVKKFQHVVEKACASLHSGINLSYFKEGLAIRGVDVGMARRPQRPLSKEELLELQNNLEEICDEMNISLRIE